MRTVGHAYCRTCVLFMYCTVSHVSKLLPGMFFTVVIAFAIFSSHKMYLEIYQNILNVKFKKDEKMYKLEE